MLSSKTAIIYSFSLLIIFINLVLEANSNSSESKVHLSLVSRSINPSNNTNHSYKKFGNSENLKAKLDLINNTSGNSLNHTENTINQKDLGTEMTMLKRLRRRISVESNACSHRNIHQDGHKVVDRCVRKKISRRNKKLHTHVSNLKGDILKKQNDMKEKKQGMKSSTLLNGKEVRNVPNTVSHDVHTKNSKKITNNSNTLKKRVTLEKIHRINKGNLSKNHNSNHNPDVQGKNSRPFVGKILSTVTGGNNSHVQKLDAKKHSHESSLNRISSNNKQRTNLHSSVKRISKIHKQKKEKEHKIFQNAAKKLNIPMSDKEHTLKNDDFPKHNDNTKHDNSDKITEKGEHTTISHVSVKPNENGLDDKKNLSELEELEKTSITFHDQESIGPQNDLLKVHHKSKENDGQKALGNGTFSKKSLKTLKVTGKAGHWKNSRDTLQIKGHDILSRIRKHPHLKSLKRNTRNEKDILHEVKDFIVHHFPKKRDENIVKLLQTHKDENIHRETRNTNDDKYENTPDGNDSTGFNPKNENFKILEELKDFVLKNFHFERTKRNLFHQNSVPLSRSYRSSKDHAVDLSRTAVRSKSSVPEKMRSNSFMNAVEESDNFWGDLQGIVKRETETNPISNVAENFTSSEYEDIEDTNSTDLSTDAHPQIMKKDAIASDTTAVKTRYSEEDNYKSDSDSVSNQYNEDSSEPATNEESTTGSQEIDSKTENEGTSANFVSTEVTSDENSETEENSESNTDNNDQDNVSENLDSSSLPNGDESTEVTSKKLIEREITTVTDISTQEELSSLGDSFSEISDISTLTSSPMTSTFSETDSTGYENSTPLSNEISSTTDVTSKDSNTNWNSESSLPSSTYTQDQESSVETSSGSLSPYSTTEESNSLTGTGKDETNSETRAPKVYRDVHHVEEEDYYDDETVSDENTSDTFEEHQDTSTIMGGLNSNRIQNTPILKALGNKVNSNDKENEYKLFTITETATKSIKHSGNIKLSKNPIHKHGGKSHTKDQNGYDTEGLSSNGNKGTSKSRYSINKDQKKKNLLNNISENEYDEEIVSESTNQDLTMGTQNSNKFRNTKGHSNLRKLQQKKSDTLSNESPKVLNSDVQSESSYDEDNFSESPFQDLTSTTESSKALRNRKGKRINPHIILQGNYEALGIEFQKLANSGANTLDYTQEESSTAKNISQTSGSLVQTVEDNKESNFGSKENSDEDEYEYETDSTLPDSTTTLVSNKVNRHRQQEKSNLKRTRDGSESVGEAFKAGNIPDNLDEVSKTSLTGLPDKEMDVIGKYTQATNNDENEYSPDVTVQIYPTTTLKTAPKSRISKEHNNHLKGEKLLNPGFGAFSKSSKLRMASLSDKQPLEDEMLPKTDKPLKEIAEDGGEKESDKSVSETATIYKLKESGVKNPTSSPNQRASSKYGDLILNLTKQGDDEQKEIERTSPVEIQHDQSFATYFVTLQNAKIMPDETTTSHTESTYSDNPRAHESLSRLQSLNDLGDEYYDEVAHISQNGERISKQVSSDNELKPLGDNGSSENGTDGQESDYNEGEMSDEGSSYGHETTDYSTASDGIEASGPEETTLNDFEQNVSVTESKTETTERLKENSEVKTTGKDKEFVRHLTSLISHLKQRRRKSQFEAVDHRVIRRTRAAVTAKLTAEPEIRQVRISPAKKWCIGGAGLIIMSLLIIGMYRTVMKFRKKERVWKKIHEANDFHPVLHHYETDNEMDDRLSDDVILLHGFIDQVMLKHEISEDGSMKEEYATAEHLSRIHSAITGTID